jgi:hypothetical protein
MINDVILSVLFHWIIDIRETLVLTEVFPHILIYIHIILNSTREKSTFLTHGEKSLTCIFNKTELARHVVNEGRE